MNDLSSRQDSTVPQQYDWWAPVYDTLWRRYLNQTLPILQQVAAPLPGERILDLASGTGELEQRIGASTPGVELVGIDLSHTMIQKSREKMHGNDSTSFIQADAHELPFADEAFDAVVSASSWHYFTSPHRVLEESARVLRPNGRFILLDWCRDYWPCRLMDAVLHWIDPAHKHCYTLEEVQSQIDDSSLTYQSGFRYRFDLVWEMMVVEAHATHRGQE